MRKFPCIILMLIALVAVLPLTAQDINTELAATTIFDSLQEPATGKGKVVVRQDPAIKKMVGVRLSGDKLMKADGDSFIKVQGFRAQVFTGNQRLSKDEAFKREREIKELFPDLATYVTYTAPFWKLRVGDFRSHEEAFNLKRQLMEAFPSYGKEIYIVKEEVNIPL